jgi:hypothetical protein
MLWLRPKWNIGMLELWNDGLKEKKNQSTYNCIHSTIPSLHAAHSEDGRKN